MSADATQVPGYATLKVGLTRKDVEEAVGRSGYPFQAVVADRLTKSLNRHTKVSGFSSVQEEWCYTDSETGQTRAVDIMASVPLGTSEKPGGPLSYPSLRLVVECKQSDLPYAFFLHRETRTDGLDLHIPEARSSIMVLIPEDSDDDHEPRMMHVRDIFGALDFRFFNSPAPHAFSVTKIKRAPKPEVTGDEAHRSLTLPLLKAADYLDLLARKDPRARGPVSIIVCLVVVRAPMLGVRVKDGESEITSMPWYRVLHREPLGSADDYGQWARTRCYDVVHEECLDHYVSTMMYALNNIADRIYAHNIELRAGIGLHRGSEKPWEGLQPVSRDRIPEEIAVGGPMVVRLADGFPIDNVQFATPGQNNEVPWAGFRYERLSRVTNG